VGTTIQIECSGSKIKAQYQLAKWHNKEYPSSGALFHIYIYDIPEEPKNALRVTNVEPLVQ
jgi:hypothetical protein